MALDKKLAMTGLNLSKTLSMLRELGPASAS